MDMGIQTVYRLETEEGKWIETTANHPYLVKKDKLATSFGRNFISNIEKYTQDQQKRVSNSYFDIQISKIDHFIASFLNLNAADNDIIASLIFIVDGDSYYWGWLARRSL